MYNVDKEWGQRTNGYKEDHQSEQNEETYPLFYLNDSEEATGVVLQNEVTLTKNIGNQEIMNEYSVNETAISSSTSLETDYTMQTSPDDISFLTEKRKNDRISFINFGGQHIYYAFHQIYLSPNAVYILVVDMTKRFDETEPTSTLNVLSQFESWTYKGM